MLDGDRITLQYIKSRIESNFKRYKVFLIIAILAGTFFLGRNLYYAENDAVVHVRYFTFYLIFLLSSVAARVALPVLYRFGKLKAVDLIITLVSILLFFCLVNISLLDSFDFEAYDFTAYIFGSAMLVFIFRVNGSLNAIIFISGMLYYAFAYYLIRPEIFRIAALLPLAAMTVFCIYFSYSRERINYRLFESNRRLEASNKALTEQTLRDPLTGLYNRRYLEELIRHVYAVFKRNGTTFSVVFADLDHFKLINDAYGHRAGDEVLKEFSRIVESESRESDLVVRYGGEEFLIILTGTALADAVIIGERIRAAVEAEDFSTVSRTVTASFGIAEVREYDDIESLLKRADEYLYEAKAGGRNRCCSGEGGAV